MRPLSLCSRVVYWRFQWQIRTKAGVGRNSGIVFLPPWWVSGGESKWTSPHVFPSQTRPSLYICSLHEVFEVRKNRVEGNGIPQIIVVSVQTTKNGVKEMWEKRKSPNSPWPRHWHCLKIGSLQRKVKSPGSALALGKENKSCFLFQGPVRNQDFLTVGWLFLEFYTRRLMESCFDLTSHFRWRPFRRFTHQSAATWWMKTKRMSARIKQHPSVPDL